MQIKEFRQIWKRKENQDKKFPIKLSYQELMKTKKIKGNYIPNKTTIPKVNVNKEDQG